ncbi:MAG: hypothetical protein ACRDD7_00890 [Peptostreptococcaceae bacterium]
MDKAKRVKLNVNMKFASCNTKLVECARTPAYCKYNNCKDIKTCENLDIYIYTFDGLRESMNTNKDKFKRVRGRIQRKE